ncbi:MarR family transcriptional regulator [Glaciihabitans sp. INWT7]|nr:MarR family transcriptional regulator [Glaciihabitans sp. INWT7]
MDRLLTDSAGRFAFVIGQLTRRLRSARGGLSHSLLSALVSVAKHGPIRLAELAQVELVSAPSITRLVAELEAKELVSRTTDPADGRASLIKVTDAGLEAVQVARRVRQQIVAELLEPLSAEEVAAIEAALPALERMVELR